MTKIINQLAAFAANKNADIVSATLDKNQAQEVVEYIRQLKREVSSNQERLEEIYAEKHTTERELRKLKEDLQGLNNKMASVNYTAAKNYAKKEQFADEVFFVKKEIKELKKAQKSIVSIDTMDGTYRLD